MSGDEDIAEEVADEASRCTKAGYRGSDHDMYTSDDLIGMAFVCIPPQASFP